MTAELRWESTTRDDDARVVVLHGELDLDLAPQLKDVLTEQLATADWLIADLADVSFMDSAALGAFIFVLGRAQDSGRRFMLINPRRSISRILDITGTHDVLVGQ